MENRYLIDLSVKYGLSGAEISKIVDVNYQADITDIDSRQFKRVAEYICEMKLINMPTEELLEEMKRKGLISQ